MANTLGEDTTPTITSKASKVTTTTCVKNKNGILGICVKLMWCTLDGFWVTSIKSQFIAKLSQWGISRTYI